MAKLKVKRMPTAEIQPTPERLAKGDVRSYVPRMPGDRTPPRRHRVTPDPNPLRDYLDRQPCPPHTTRAEHDRNMLGLYEGGQALGAAYERATREGGAVNLDSMGGGFNGGLSHARCEAMSDLHHMIARLGDTEHDRLNRARILIEVCGKRRSLRDLAPGGRAFQRNSNMLLTGLRALTSGST